ncbi:MAG: hypothetical protein PSV36_17890 [Algoriphagus sp.]|nr:hypothetical protein [Algoriphagus sp.]
MSKKLQLTKDGGFMNSGNYSADNSSANLISLKEKIKLDIRKGPDQFQLLSIRSFNKPEKQSYINARNKTAKFINIKKSNQFLSFNIGLVFVFIVFNALNAHILSL